MRILILFILFISILFPSYGQRKYPPVERLVYTGYYNWGLIWIRAGRVEFKETHSEKYPGATKLEAVGASLPSWDWVFKLRDTLTSHFNPETFLPYESSRKAHEGNYHKTFNYQWDYKRSRVLADIHKIGRYKRQDTIKLQPNTYDMLSVAWKARELDFDKYSVGELIPIKMLIDSKIYDLHVRYQGTDKVKIAGKRQECYVFSPLLVEGDVFKGGENMKIWVSKDERRLPLMVEAKILVGSVKGILEPAESKY